MSDISSALGDPAATGPIASKPARTRLGPVLLLVAALIASACAAAEDGLPEDETTTTPTDEVDDRGDAASDATEGDAGQGSSDPTTPDPFEPSITDDEVAARLEGLGGTLAVGFGPQLLVSRADGRARIVLDGSESVTAAQPTWSNDGTRLAWGSFSAERQILQFQDFDAEGLPSDDPVSSDASGLPIFYLQWTEDGSRLAYIRNDAAAAQVEVGTVEPGSPIEPGGTGAPFFISWSPDGQRLAGHVNERTIEVFDRGAGGTDSPTGDGFEPVLEIDGVFSAPDWLDDERLLIADAGSLAAFEPSTGAVETLADLPGIVRFVLSPDRRRIAYQVVVSPSTSAASFENSTGDRNVPPGALTVLDVETGERKTVTSETAVSWEWSPNSDKLAWMGIGGAAARWNFWSADGATIGTPATPEFRPTRKVAQNYLPFFAQYTQSVNRWSPDSTAFAFAGTVGGRSGVWVQIVDETVLPVRVGNGDFVSWGSGPALPPIGDVSSRA